MELRKKRHCVEFISHVLSLPMVMSMSSTTRQSTYVSCDLKYWTDASTSWIFVIFTQMLLVPIETVTDQFMVSNISRKYLITETLTLRKIVLDSNLLSSQSFTTSYFHRITSTFLKFVLVEWDVITLPEPYCFSELSIFVFEDVYTNRYWIRFTIGEFHESGLWNTFPK